MGPLNPFLVPTEAPKALRGNKNQKTLEGALRAKKNKFLKGLKRDKAPEALSAKCTKTSYPQRPSDALESLIRPLRALPYKALEGSP